MGSRKQIDWEAIEKEIRSNQLSIREIARQFGVSEGAIRKRIKAKGIKRDLAEQVRKRVREKIVRSEVRTPNASEEEIVEEAAERGADVVKLHRQDIANLRNEEQKILQELGDKPTKLWVGQFQGQVIEHVVGIAVTERAAALHALAGVQHKRIQLERQAYGIDDDGRKPEEIEEIKITLVKPNEQ